jgi:hypothetical protein
MKNLLIYFLLFGYVSYSSADMPGNKPREEVTILIEFGKLEGYTIYSSGSYSSDYKSIPVKDSSEHILQGGYGAPPCITFFGINNQERHTDSITVCNEEQGNVVLELSVQNGKLISEESLTTKQEIIPVVTDNPSTDKPSFFSQPTNILIITALAAILLLLGLYFIMQRKKQAV